MSLPYSKHILFRYPSLLFFILLLILQFISTVSNAQLSTQYNFGSLENGHTPYSAPISDGTFLYGMTYDGGINNFGIVYKIKPDGSGFTKLLDLDDSSGKFPYGSLYYDGSFLYGMTTAGGGLGTGSIFKIKTDGTGFSKILDFDYANTGGSAFGALISDGTFLYGTTVNSSTTFGGTIFKIKPDGSGFSKIYEFDINSTGSYSYGSLYYDGTFLYGLTSGGIFNNGSMFKIKTDGTGFFKMVTFNNSSTGTTPFGSVVSDGTFLYGTTLRGGSNNLGSIFRILPDGTGFTQILSFNNSVAGPGSTPKGSLTYDAGFLYGTTTDYGANGRGTVFKVQTPDATGLVKLADVDVGTTNSSPEGTLLLQGSTLYGVKSGGGAGAAPFPPGTLFKVGTNGTGYSWLHTFEIEASVPTAKLYSDGTYQYGTTEEGGIYNYGTVFKVKMDGTGFVRLYDFTGTNGKNPIGSLTSDGTYLYGTTSQGGTTDGGVLFKIKPDGTGFTKLIDFDYPTTGSLPGNSVIYDGTFLYGMTGRGGPDNSGTIYKIKTDGTGYVHLFDFDYTASGAYPEDGFVSDGTFLYGMTQSGGVNSVGVVFKIKTDGTGYSKLLDFDTNNNGSNPHGPLILDGTFLYGMNSGGGAKSNGTAFRIRTDGSGYAKLLDFETAVSGFPSNGGFLYDGAYLYASTSGGANGKGTLFRIKPDGTGYQKYIDFSIGNGPVGSLTTDGTNLYGVTHLGGTYNGGTYFKSTKTPFVTISKFEPDEGAVGTYITITGTQFDPIATNNVVKFNNVDAKVISSTSTTIRAIVPVGATSGAISVANGTTGVSTSDFIVTDVSYMIDGNTVQNCEVDFAPLDVSDDAVQTFLPENPGDKVKVVFTDVDIGDVLNIYDGPNTSSPLIKSIQGTAIPAEIVATNGLGALTFEFVWQDDSSDWYALISCASNTVPLNITTQPTDFSNCAGTVATFSTSASGTTNITYQWQYATAKTGTYADITNGSNYSNTTTSTLSVNTKSGFGTGFYRCKVRGDLSGTVFTNAAQLSIKISGCGPTIAATQAATQVGGQVSINLVPLITVPGNNLDLTSLQILSVLPSGATASITGAGILNINYSGNGFTGTEQLTIKACDNNGNCSTQAIGITVAGEVVVYNGLSPNSDNKNDILYLENIDLLDETKVNHVTIYNRWGDQVFEVDNYNNKNAAFDGHNKSGGTLPTGTYFYKITFASGKKEMTGYLSLKR